MRISMGCTVLLGAVMAAGTMQGQHSGGGAPASSSAGVAPAASANSSMAADTGMTQPVMGDKMFVKKAIMGSNSEIAAAKMALQKSSNPQVQQFAQKMVDDHTKMLDDMKGVATQENIAFKDEPSPEGKKLAAKLDGLSGPEFDKAYVNGMVKDHKGDVRDFTAEVNTGKDQPTKDAAQKGLPVIQEHLQMIEGIQKSMKS